MSEKLLEEYGYYGHLVNGEPDSDTPSGTNFHTHGFPESWNHPDVQIVLNIPPQVCSSIFEAVKNMAKENKTIETEKKYDDFLDGMSIQFAWATEGGRDILRAILPDKEGQTDKGSIKEPFAVQWKGTRSRRSKQ